MQFLHIPDIQGVDFLETKTICIIIITQIWVLDVFNVLMRSILSR